MPSKSKAQHNLMAMVAHDPKAAKRLGIPQSVGEEFMQADKGKKLRFGGSTNAMRQSVNKPKTHHGEVQMPYASLQKHVGLKKGGVVKHDDIKEDKKLIKKAFGMHDKQEHPGKKTDLSKLKGGGMAKAKETMGPRTMSKDVEAGSNTKRAFGQHGVQKRGLTRGTEMRGNPVTEPTNIGTKAKMVGMKKGGKIDGIASRGKTKGTMVTMCGGGKAKRK